MSNEKLSPEIMEMITQEIQKIKHKDFHSVLMDAAIFGATIALTKQWVKVEEELKDLRIQFECMQDNDCKSLAERIFFDGMLAIIDTRIAALPAAPNNNQK